MFQLYFATYIFVDIAYATSAIINLISITQESIFLNICIQYSLLNEKMCYCVYIIISNRIPTVCSHQNKCFVHKCKKEL